MALKNLWSWHPRGVSSLSLRDDEFPPEGVGCLATPLYVEAHSFRLGQYLQARALCDADL